MRPKLTIKLFTCLLIIGIISACDDTVKDEDTYFSEGSIAVSVNNEIRIAPKERLKDIVRKSASEMYVGTAASRIEVLDAHVAQSGKYRYLFASAVKDGASLTIAIELVAHIPDANNTEASVFSFASNKKSEQISYIYLPGEKHSCSGNNCESCDFKKDRDGKITGCECNSVGSMTGGSSYCNHTIST